MASHSPGADSRGGQVVASPDTRYTAEGQSIGGDAEQRERTVH